MRRLVLELSPDEAMQVFKTLIDEIERNGKSGEYSRRLHRIVRDLEQFLLTIGDSELDRITDDLIAAITRDSEFPEIIGD